MHARIEVKTRFIYLWLKYVSNFDMGLHGGKCLLGNYSKLIPYRHQAGDVFEGTLDEHETPYLYLCGIVPSYDDCVHIAFEPASANDMFEYEDANIKVSIAGARRLQISPLPEKAQLMFPKAFSRCRNFQFGYHYFYRKNFFTPVTHDFKPVLILGLKPASTPLLDITPRATVGEPMQPLPLPIKPVNSVSIDKFTELPSATEVRMALLKILEKDLKVSYDEISRKRLMYGTWVE